MATKAIHTAQINAEFYRNLGVIAEDEAMLDKVYKYVRRMARQLMDDPTRMDKEEYFAMLERSKAQAEKGMVYRFDDKQKMMNWLNSL